MVYVLKARGMGHGAWVKDKEEGGDKEEICSIILPCPPRPPRPPASPAPQNL